MTKRELRARMEALLRNIDGPDLARRSAEVMRRFQQTPAWARAGILLCFLSMAHEIETGSLVAAALASGRRVAVPRIEKERIRFYFLPGDPGNLPRDTWGIPVPAAGWQPLALERGTRLLVAVPGLAFDRAGNRLGRGKGYYDGFLREARAAAGNDLTAVGICLSDQLVDEVPCNERDQRLDGVVTERESILVPRS